MNKAIDGSKSDRRPLWANGLHVNKAKQKRKNDEQQKEYSG